MATLCACHKALAIGQPNVEAVTKRHAAGKLGSSPRRRQLDLPGRTDPLAGHQWEFRATSHLMPCSELRHRAHSWAGAMIIGPVPSPEL